MKKKVVVVGAGVIGLHCAYYLSESGHDVTIIDKISEADESGCSYGNCGFIVPSHFIPIASPAMLKSGLRMMFDPQSPVQMSLSKNIKHYGWFYNFLKFSTSQKVNAVAPTLFQLNSDSLFLYHQFYKQHQEHRASLKHNGLLLLSTTQKGLNEEIEIAEKGIKLGASIELLNIEKLKTLEPELELDVEGGVLYNTDGMIAPEKHMHLLKEILLQKGVKFYYNQKIEDLVKKADRITKVQTLDRTFKADEFVIATGAFSQVLAKKIDLYLPVIAGKGYSVDYDNKGVFMKTPIILNEAKVAISPFQTKIRLGSGMEFNGKKGQISKSRVEAAINNTKKAIPSLNTILSETPDVWEGLRPVSPDGMPFIGRTQKAKNVLIATGHAMMGMSLGPISGRLITDFVNENYVIQSYMSMLDPDRFDK